MGEAYACVLEDEREVKPSETGDENPFWSLSVTPAFEEGGGEHL